MKGAVIQAKAGIADGILNFLKEALDKGFFDALLLPVRVPAGDSFSYILMRDTSLLDGAFPLPPVMPVQGARALSSLTRYGKGTNRIAVLMRPCEIRAAIELHKLDQVDLENIFLLSVDCPGVLPLGDYIKDPRKGDALYEKVLQEWIIRSPRWACDICDKFSMPHSDAHFGILGAPESSLFVIPGTTKGKDFLESLDIEYHTSVKSWETKVQELTEEISKKREQTLQALSRDTRGPERLLGIFSKCINCHNCMRVCPICYCRQCYFDSDALKLTPDNYLMRAQKKGALRFMPDTLLFQLGRMSHMGLSCVSCGTCEDACPMAIPVSRIFTLVADSMQEVFDYVAGRNPQDPLPQIVYKEEELKEVEKAYIETYNK
ncbi:MAG: hypothetical protein AMJ92_08510 [candidate division Zixibacteria bacterium SM23_81]|nr:MAG: hypothetical protein AMJ92_08510 [candidate division Zixibacteria bacterium SM23_81]